MFVGWGGGGFGCGGEVMGGESKQHPGQSKSGLAGGTFCFFFPNDLRCGFRKLKEEGVGNLRSGAAVVPKSLLVLL